MVGTVFYNITKKNHNRRKHEHISSCAKQKTRHEGIVNYPGDSKVYHMTVYEESKLHQNQIHKARGISFIFTHEMLTA